MNCWQISSSQGVHLLGKRRWPQTRDNLFRRRVIQDEGEQNCVMCGSEAETAVHLFVYCDFAVQMRKGMIMIWNAVIWTLWLHRNKIVFENGIGDVEGLVAEVKISSSKWWIERTQATPCLFYEWNQEPLICIGSV
ncbi:uncharacterized protein LOC123896035 [Trifolium pratense]|uniref:uncharacterized protein LOC123896035 n=1 Tax=Trifolium pratense TaxID=57577 RepID=UPI001E694B1F|nr:uncharacterized protein LOC123896035 [Trifolium pratense]